MNIGIWKLSGGFISRRFTMMQLMAATKLSNRMIAPLRAVAMTNTSQFCFDNLVVDSFAQAEACGLPNRTHEIPLLDLSFPAEADSFLRHGASVSPVL